MAERLRLGSDGVTRCAWCGDDPLYVRYHDEEWGHPGTSDVRLFEKLCLEGFQSGLSWLTILRKRENFREAFAQFELEAVARFDAQDVARLLADIGIVRHRGKILSAIGNAGRALALIEETGSLFEYVSRYRASRTARIAPSQPLQPTSPESIAMSKDLKKRGWTFVGPTTVYAFMQAMGVVDDHFIGCERTPR